MRLFGLALALAVAAPLAAQARDEHSHPGMPAPAEVEILEGFGVGGFPITTANLQAQAYFNNGMQLAHAFEHQSAVAAMREASRLDPTCAMCVWGEAWAGGPTINFGKEGDDLKQLAVLAAKARDLARAKGTPLERQLTEALVRRYENGGGWKPGDRAFAEALDVLALANPQSDALATLAADAWLMTDADPNGDPKLLHARPLWHLERVLRRSPDYTPAMHFYIHAAEGAGEPARAEAAANRLAMLAPKSQHLVHMPSHILYWIGRYEEAGRTNRRAVEIGLERASKSAPGNPDAAWDMTYHPHNVFFGLGGALMAGDRDTAQFLAESLVAQNGRVSAWSAFRQTAGGMGYVALALYNGPEAMLALPAPKLPWLKGQWHYGRGEAYALQGNAAAVRREMKRIAVPGTTKDGFSAQASTALRIARKVLEGRAAMIEGKPQQAATAFEAAARMQENRAFAALADPPLWWYPVRRSLAEARLAAGDAAGARSEAEATLIIRPKDPATLQLLAKLEAAGAGR